MFAPSLSRSSAPFLIATLMALNAVAVSTLYWAQALAGLARSDLGPSVWLSLMPSATLAGYAIGVALLASVARDMTTANGIGLHALLLGTGLGAAAVAPAAPAIMVACCLVGMGCSLTQRALACATSAVSSMQRGPVIGCVIASGLIGIVIARAGIPAASAAVGWRSMFMLDAALICSLGLAAAIMAQRTDRRLWEGETFVVPSAVELWRREPILRRAALQQACVFAAYNGGWAIFPRLLAQHDAGGAVLIGIVASVGAGAALMAGWLCRHRGPATIAVGGLGAVLVAVVGAIVVPAASPALYLAMILLDAGTQTALVANQAQSQALATSPAMRGRLAAIVTTTGFTAGAVGAAIGNALF